MNELKPITAANIIALRTAAGMTQAELGEKLNYSDKTVSKWERAEAVPDASVLKAMAQLFGVSVDYMLSEHTEWSGDAERHAEEQARKNGVSVRMITFVTLAGIWTMALFIFVLFWLFGSFPWFVFLAAVPVSLITLLVFNSVWNHGRHNDILVAVLVASIFLLIYVLLHAYRPWQLFLVLVPSEIIVFLAFRIRAHH